MEENPLYPHSDALRNRLFAARTVILSGEIDQQTASVVTAQLTALAAASGDAITVYVNAQGGRDEAGDALHDLIGFIGPRVRMVGTGWVAGVAALVYVAVPRTDRYCLPNSRFQLHQPERRTPGPGRDLVAEAEATARRRERIHRLFARATGQPLERIEQDMRRPLWMDAEEAVAYGLVGRVVTRIDEVPGAAG